MMEALAGWMDTLKAWLAPFTAWMRTPIWENSFLPNWIWLTAAGALILFILLFCLCRKKSRRHKAAASEPVTLHPQPDSLHPLAVANLQGIGHREEQQDAFRISPLSALQEQGLLCTLCDGMGGMDQGGEIARYAAAQIASRFPMGRPDAFHQVPPMLRELSEDIYRRFQGRGGTTLVLTYTKEQSLWFWCIGDSDLFLLREGRLHALNRRHEYRCDLMEQAMLGESLSVMDALNDPKGGALTAYLGLPSPACDYTHRPIRLQKDDALLLCSDGVSDTLTLSQISSTLQLQPQECCAELEKLILEKNKNNQDNYSAIALRFNDLQPFTPFNGGMNDELENNEHTDTVNPEDSCAGA